MMKTKQGKMIKHMMKWGRKFRRRLRTFPAYGMLLVPFAGSMTLSWEASPSPDLMGYKVYIGTAPGEYFSIRDVGATTEVTFTDLSRTKRYYFVVTAYDSLGNESRFSEEVSAIIDPLAEEADIKKSYNFPNPFNPAMEVTYIRFFLDEPGPVTVQIFTVDNRLVRTLLDNEQQTAGEHRRLAWDGRDDSGRPVVNGVYFGRISKPGGAELIKIAIVRR